MIKPKVHLGKRYRDPISGFEGICTGLFHYLHGCIRCNLSGTNKDGEPKDFTFDEPQLVEIKADTTFKPTRGRGGPKDTPPRVGP